MTRSTLLFGVAAAAVASVPMGAAIAQGAPPSQADTANAAPDPKADADIVVTASKFGETSLARTAVSAEVIRGDVLAQRRISDPIDLASGLAGVHIDRGSTTPKISIRGVGFDNFQIQAENGIASYVNGIVIQRTQAQIVPFLDLERVDVLKGPQGSSFGRNATGGVINYIANKPKEGFAAEVGGGFGSFGRRFADGYVNYGTERFGVRVAGKFDDDNGFSRNLVTGNRVNTRGESDSRISLYAKPVDDLTLNFFWQHWQDDIKEGVENQNATSQATAAFLTDLVGPRVNPAVPAAGIINSDYTVINRIDGRLKDNVDLYGFTGDYKLGNVTLTSITGILDFHSINPLDVGAPSNSSVGLISSVVNPVDSHQFSQELLLRGKSGALKWVVGGYYLHEKAQTFGGHSILAGLGAPDLYFDNGQRLRSLAGYADGQFSLSDTIRLNAGIRYTADRKQAFGFAQSFGVPKTGMPLDGYATSSHRITGQAGAEADLTSTLFGYVKYARGYKAGGINNNAATLYRPETLDSFEAGLKGSAFDRAFHYALTGFYSKYKDIQANEILVSGIQTIINASSAKIAGLEVTADVKATDYLSFDASYSWMPKADYGTFINGVGTDYSGARLSRTPKFSGLFGVNLDLPLADDLSMHARAETYHASTVVFNQGAKFFPDKLSQRRYDLVNANVTLTYDKRYDLTFFARNLTNKFYLNDIVDVYQTFQYGEYGRPRELGLEARVRF